MLKNLLGTGKNEAEAPDGMRLYAIGDIHGCADLLDELLSMIETDAGDAKTSRLIFLGDYVDRGSESRDVIERLIALHESDQSAVFLKGNHEAALLDFLEDPVAHEEWLHWGGAETMESYGVENIWNREAADLGEEFAQKMPAAHVDFLNDLALTHREGDYFFVHAGVRPGVALVDQTEEDLLWIRSVFHAMPAKDRPEEVIVHGHQPMKKPLDAGWRIAVDTGACWSGKLTAVVLEGADRRFISTG